MIHTIFNESRDGSYLPFYEHWIQCDYWIHVPYDYEYINSELVMLLMNFDASMRPMTINEFGKIILKYFDQEDNNYIDDFLPCSEQNLIYDLIERALECNGLENTVIKDKNNDNKVKEYHIKPTDFIRWAKKRGMRIAEPFMVLLEEKLPEGTPPYLDPKHPDYSTELAASVSAWLGMYENKIIELKKDLSEKNQIEEWVRAKFNKQLEKRYGQIESALGRISTVVNPDNKKKKGRPLKKKPIK